MRELTLNGLRMKVLDEYSIFLLVYREVDNEYLILRKDTIREYTVMYNLGCDKEHAYKEFNSIKRRISSNDN